MDTHFVNDYNLYPDIAPFYDSDIYVGHALDVAPSLDSLR